MKKNETYKEFPNQNYLETRFNVKSHNQLSYEDAKELYDMNVT